MRRILALILVTGLAAAAAYYVLVLRPEGAPKPVAALPPKPSAAPAATTIKDPLRPEAPIEPDDQRPPPKGDWIKARPGFQHSLSASQRGGVEPCATQTVDSSGFEAPLPRGRARLHLPRDFAPKENGDFDLIIHLHGDEPVRRELIESGQKLPLLTITLGLNEGYAPLFSSSELFRAYVADIEQVLSRRSGRPAHARKVAMSAWSAGFVGVAAAISQKASSQIDAVVLIDGLHAPRRDRAMFEAQLEPFVKFARRAADKQAFMFISHSSIDPPDFASTTECAHYLLSTLGFEPRPVHRADRFGLELVEFFNRGDLNVRGYAGNDKADHCAQIALLRDVYRALGQRWAAH
ncbi:MAG TPA: hypothetical protein VEQ58_07515 [Polyangiaceae bacterium]|nr:hypothetical protein [Polyangiaceae bacterium]